MVASAIGNYHIPTILLLQVWIHGTPTKGKAPPPVKGRGLCGVAVLSSKCHARSHLAIASPQRKIPVGGILLLSPYAFPVGYAIHGIRGTPAVEPVMPRAIRFRAVVAWRIKIARTRGAR